MQYSGSKLVQGVTPFAFKVPYYKKTIYFLRKLILSKKNKISIDYSEVKEITKGNVIVFYAQIEKAFIEYHKRFRRTGALPKSKKIRKILMLPDLTKHEHLLINSNLSDAEKASLVNPEIIDKAVDELKKIGPKVYYNPLNTFLTELIGNAVEHGIQNKKINWWLTQDIDRVNKKIDFTFVDMGNGIVQTHKNAGLPTKYLFLPDSKIVVDAFNGKLMSSTKQISRGKGLPQLRRLIEDNIVSEVTILTNKVLITFDNDVIITRKSPNFVGTFYTWTVTYSNIEQWIMRQSR